MANHVLPYPREFDVADFVGEVFEPVPRREQFIHFGIADRLVVMHNLKFRTARVFVKMRTQFFIQNIPLSLLPWTSLFLHVTLFTIQII